jgi:hypothetical protein
MSGQYVWHRAWVHIRVSLTVFHLRPSVDKESSDLRALRASVVSPSDPQPNPNLKPVTCNLKPLLCLVSLVSWW